LALNQQNVYFVGPMGAGKTTLGRAVARQLGWPFFDSDQEIALRCGVEVSVIFELEGEQGFRHRERQMIDALTWHNGIVLATGGGAVLLPENRALLRNRGIVIYLRATPHELWLRLRHDRTRPLLQTAHPQGRLSALHAQRDPLYREVADFVIDTGRANFSRLVHLVINQLELAGLTKT